MNRHLFPLAAFVAINFAGGCTSEVGTDSLRESQDGLVAESQWTEKGIHATLSARDSTVLVRFDYDKARATGEVSLDQTGYRTQFEVPATAPPLTLDDGNRTVWRMWHGRDQLDDTQRLWCRWIPEMDCPVGWPWNDHDPTPVVCCWY